MVEGKLNKDYNIESKCKRNFLLQMRQLLINVKMGGEEYDVSVYDTGR